MNIECGELKNTLNQSINAGNTENKDENIDGVEEEDKRTDMGNDLVNDDIDRLSENNNVHKRSNAN